MTTGREEIEDVEEVEEEEVEAEEVETGEEEEEPPSPDETEEPPQKKKTPEEGLKAALHAEREAKRELKREIEEIKARLNPPKEKTEAEEAAEIEAEVVRRVGPRPTLESCDFDTEKYADTLTDWKLEKNNLTQSFKAYVANQRETAKRQENGKAEFLATVTAKGKGVYEDFLEVAYIPEGAIGLFAELDNAADVAYALGKDPAAAKKLADLLSSGRNPALFLGQFSAQVTPRSKLKEKETKLKPTQTQRPGSGGEQSTDAKAVKAARDEALKSGNFTAYLEKIGAF